MKNSAIVLAAGSGKRMNTTTKKQYLLLQDKPLLYYSLEVFEKSEIIDEVVLVVAPGEETYVKEEILDRFAFCKVHTIVQGGKQRYHSVYNGLQSITDCDYVFIHDGARPLITQDILRRAYKQVQQSHACVVGMPIKDTIKIVDKNCFIENTPKREQVWSVQTPQVFECALIKKAYHLLIEKEEQIIDKGITITDDAMVAETFTDLKIPLIEGSYQNIKITTSEDLQIAEALIELREKHQ